MKNFVYLTQIFFAYSYFLEITNIYCKYKSYIIYAKETG